jgi:hypothetical protein
VVINALPRCHRKDAKLDDIMDRETKEVFNGLQKSVQSLVRSSMNPFLSTIIGRGATDDFDSEKSQAPDVSYQKRIFRGIPARGNVVPAPDAPCTRREA